MNCKNDMSHVWLLVDLYDEYCSIVLRYPAAFIGVVGGGGARGCIALSQTKIFDCDHSFHFKLFYMLAPSEQWTLPLSRYAYDRILLKSR